MPTLYDRAVMGRLVALTAAIALAGVGCANDAPPTAPATTSEHDMNLMRPEETMSDGRTSPNSTPGTGTTVTVVVPPVVVLPPGTVTVPSVMNTADDEHQPR